MSNVKSDENMVFQRLCNLWEKLGINVEDFLERAELLAYCEGIKIVSSELERMKRNTALNLFEHITKEELENDFSLCEVNLDGLDVSIGNGFGDDIGVAVSKWFTPAHNISLGSTGKSWESIEALGLSFVQIENRKYRWDMIESR